MTADGKHIAVAWQSADGFLVRVHDGKKWGAEIELPGKEAAIAFGAAGTLFAASSLGLSRLEDGHFTLFEKTAYAQPALAVDKDGKSHVAWHKDGKVFYAGKEVSAGERPALVIDAQGTAHLGYLANGALALRSLQGETWSAAQTFTPPKPAWPALALGDKEVRLSYLGPASRGPDALWLLRLPDKEPVLLPSLAGNVTDSWLVVKFALNNQRDTYRPHSVLVSLNGVWLQWFRDTVPDGRYLFRVDPQEVFTSTGQPAPNRVSIQSWHMNAGHYSLNSDYALTVRTAWSEYFAFAGDADEVRRAAEQDRRVNHNQPDLALLANSLDLPVRPPAGKSVDFPVTIANLGEGVSKTAKVVMLDGQAVLAEAEVPPLQPGEQRLVTMRLDGRLRQVRFAIRQEQADFDPSNDSLDLWLWGPQATDPAKAAAHVLLKPADAAPAWLMGDVPAGARLLGEWHWHESPALLSPRSHAGPAVKGPALHYFLHAPEPLVLDKGDNLVQYVYLDPKNPPKQILLQLYAGGTQLGQRVYWGEKRLDLGGDPGTRLGDLPPAGKWVRLRIPLQRFGLSRAEATGLLFGQYDGRAFWGATTRSTGQDDAAEMLTVPE